MLAILFVIAGAVAPSVVSMMSEYRLKQAVESVRIALAATRVHAIDLSSTYQFRFEQEGRRWLALPTDSEVINATVPPAPIGGGNAAGLQRSPFQSGEMDEHFKFQTVLPTSVGGGSAVPNQSIVPAPSAAGDAAFLASMAKLPTAINYGSVAWSPPILFHPDGTASDAALQIVDQRGAGFRLTVRELTGEISVQRIEQGAF